MLRYGPAHRPYGAGNVLSDLVATTKVSSEKKAMEKGLRVSLASTIYLGTTLLVAERITDIGFSSGSG